MGYCHHWDRPFAIDSHVFSRIRLDFEKLVLPLADIGCSIAGPLGANEPEITAETICFNGLRDCGHPKPDRLVPMVFYPTEEAGGIDDGVTTSFNPKTLQTFIERRRCDGQCAHDAFLFPRVLVQGLGGDAARKLSSDFVKTAFKPYDVAVTAALLIAKRYLQEEIVVHSDGSDAQWADARRLCQAHLGYGDWFGIVEQEETYSQPDPTGIEVERRLQVRALVELAVRESFS
jgi:hypothetical protein